ncbi:hypothetical protein E4H12_12680 [Candidatus Thorarchaeota archaeon]|nr:MAG: hypothetical protein E4H12_12680 [Candidatus Thorarchaeota archaeon]
MCTISVIYDYGQQLPQTFWTEESFEHYHQLLEAAKLFDQQSGQPDCEDPSKALWIETIKSRLLSKE